MKNKECEDFRKEYYKLHAACPVCHATEHHSTMVGFLLDYNKVDEYKDLNDCECLACGDKHTTHDRVMKPNSITKDILREIIENNELIYMTSKYFDEESYKQGVQELINELYVKIND